MHGFDRFRGTPVSVISDNLDRLAGPCGLQPFHRSGQMCGLAVTVKTRAGDNLFVHRALELLQPGDVLVVDGGGDVSRALVGDIMKAIAESKGAGGFVIDGAIRDAAAFATSDFPTFARAAIHRGPYKDGPGEINVPVSIGGFVISPGDIVVGDFDGVVAFSQTKASNLAEAVRQQLAREDVIKQSIAAGTYKGAYGASA
ncbi:MAG: RraA family protein, partial [Hyphomicrobiaceae bacterium]|nr:RraA family protein [Hyphomicrobiaceae bacterium]